ncbi:MAG: GldG family protein [Candidatus Krumholzibacteriota bacterium]|nr:GldG family protein [Candidatus Krumholzibacteriota bacterium]
MKRLSFRITFAAAVVLLIGIAVFLNGILGDLRGARVDLTEDKLFTLTASAANILDRLQVPVQIKYYVTREDKMPTGLKTLERDVTDKLRDYADASGGHLQFSVHDPTDDEALQQVLQGKGVRPFQVQSMERDEIALKLIWSAITIAYKDKGEEILPQVLPQSLETLEYEVVSRVYRLTQEARPLVAVFATRPTLDPQMAAMYMQMGMEVPELPDPWMTAEEFLRQEHYDVRRIDLTADDPVPPEAEALLVLGPVNLSERQAWEIGRAVSRGVNALIAVQNQEYRYDPSPQGGFRITAQQRASGLERLLGHWGLAVGNQQLFDAENEVLSIPRTQNFMGMRVQTAEPVRAPMQIAVRGEQLNRDVSITNRIDQLFYLWGTDLATDAARLVGGNVGSRVLFTTSKRAWHKPYGSEPLTIADIDPRNREFEANLPLAYLLDGQFAPPDWERPAWGDAAADSADAEGAADAPAPAPAQLVLVGCAKMFEEPFVKAGQNGLFLLNAVDALALGGDLIGIRSKIITQRSIRPVEAGQKLLLRLFTVALVPVLLIVLGVTRSALRRRESNEYHERLKARAR